MAIICPTVDTSEFIPLALGTVDDVVLLQLDKGTNFTLFSSSVDNVDNRLPFQVAMEQHTQLNFPVVMVTCPEDCNGNGNCTVFGDCVCQEGFYGNDCSQCKYWRT